MTWGSWVNTWGPWGRIIKISVVIQKYIKSSGPSLNLTVGQLHAFMWGSRVDPLTSLAWNCGKSTWYQVLVRLQYVVIRKTCLEGLCTLKPLFPQCPSYRNAVASSRLLLYQQNPAELSGEIISPQNGILSAVNNRPVPYFIYWLYFVGKWLEKTAGFQHQPY